MEIKFTNIDNLWVAEFEVTKDFNLHLERDTEGRLDIYQRTAGGDYEYIYDTGYLNKRTVYDNDFQALVYPKWIKIKSAVKPLVATITTDGEVNEVVYQAKDIEITSNGTTKVTADTGYTALASVNVKVNVPSEGGGSGGETIYVKAGLNDLELDPFLKLLRIANLCKYNDSRWQIATVASQYVRGTYEEDLYENCSALSINLDDKLYNMEFFTVRQEAESLDFFNSLQRITKEEFYSLESIPS